MSYPPEQRTIIGTLFSDAPAYHAFLESTGAFLEQEILPEARKIDKEAIFPDGTWRR